MGEGDIKNSQKSSDVFYGRPIREFYKWRPPNLTIFDPPFLPMSDYYLLMSPFWRFFSWNFCGRLKFPSQWLSGRPSYKSMHVDNIEVLWSNMKIEENSRENENTPLEIIWPNCPTVNGARRTVACYSENFRAQAYQLNVQNEVASWFFHQIVH